MSVICAGPHSTHVGKRVHELGHQSSGTCACPLPVALQVPAIGLGVVPGACQCQCGPGSSDSEPALVLPTKLAPKYQVEIESRCYLRLLNILYCTVTCTGTRRPTSNFKSFQFGFNYAMWPKLQLDEESTRGVPSKLATAQTSSTLPGPVCRDRHCPWARPAYTRWRWKY